MTIISKFLSLFLLIAVLAGCGSPSSLKYLEEATQYDDLSLPSGKDQRVFAAYLEQHKRTITLLTQAADYSPIDNHTFHTLQPERIEFIKKVPGCIRLLMLDFTYAVSIKQEPRAKSALVTAMRTNDLIARVPFLYGQLCRTGIAGILLEKIQATVDWTGDGLEIFNDMTISDFCSLLREQETTFLTGYRNSLLYESQLSEEYLCRYFKLHINPEREVDDDDTAALAKQYRDLCRRIADSLDQPFDHNWTRILADANGFNRNFKVEMIAPDAWKYNYLKAVSDLRILRIVFEAVKFKKNHGKFPRSLEQFPPEDIQTNGLISFDYAGSDNAFKITSSVKGSSFEYRMEREESSASPDTNRLPFSN